MIIVNYVRHNERIMKNKSKLEDNHATKYCKVSMSISNEKKNLKFFCTRKIQQIISNITFFCIPRVNTKEFFPYCI